MEKNTFKSNVINHSLNHYSEKTNDVSIKNRTNTTGNTPIIDSYPPPPPPLSLEYKIRPKGSLFAKGSSSAKGLFYSLSLILIFFLFLGCPENITTYVDVPINVTNTITNNVTNTITNNVTNTITNTITDTNTPMVTNHNFAVTENIAFGTVIGTINASDDIAVTSYLIIAGNDSYAFSINTNGQLKTIMTLDYDTTPNYNLTVQVSDGAGNSSNATITVSVTDVDAPPTVTTLSASQIQNNNATLNGNINRLGSNGDGSQQVGEYGFVYSTNASQTNNLLIGESGAQKTVGLNSTSTGVYSHTIAGLSQGINYYFRAFAVNDGGTSYGEVSNFSTTYHQIFTLNSVTNGSQSNSIYPQSTHTYTASLSHELVYSLTVEANSNISSNVSVYEGFSANPLYIKAGPFSSTPELSAITFAGIGNGTNGHRYMILPLASNSHRIVISNDSEQTENYSLNLEEYLGTSPDTRRLLVDPQRMGYYDSTNDPRFFWFHLPANKKLQIEFDGIRAGGTGQAAISASGFSDISFSSSATSTRSFNFNFSEPQYLVVSTRNQLFATGAGQQTSIRLIFRFVD